MDQVLGDEEGAFSLRHFPAMHLMLARDYEGYPDLFATGGIHPYGAHDEAFLDQVATALDVLPRMFLSTVLPTLPDLATKLQAGAKILDVGCGAGAAIVKFAELFPNVTCVGEDIEPTSIRMAQDRIAQHGLDRRVRAQVADASAWPDDLADGSFDLVMSYLVLHEIDPRYKLDLLRESVRALAPDGFLLIFDERYPSEPAELRDPARIFAVMAQWYEVTWGNVLNTREEIQYMLAEVGLRVVEETALSRFHIVIARR
jgi:SAM-dependent methyltransferase